MAGGNKEWEPEDGFFGAVGRVVGQRDETVDEYFRREYERIIESKPSAGRAIRRWLNGIKIEYKKGKINNLESRIATMKVRGRAAVEKTKEKFEGRRQSMNDRRVREEMEINNAVRTSRVLARNGERMKREILAGQQRDREKVVGFFDRVSDRVKVGTYAVGLGIATGIMDVGETVVFLTEVSARTLVFMSQNLLLLTNGFGTRLMLGFDGKQEEKYTKYSDRLRNIQQQRYLLGINFSKKMSTIFHSFADSIERKTNRLRQNVENYKNLNLK